MAMITYRSPYYYCAGCNRWWQRNDKRITYTQMNPLAYDRAQCPDCVWNDHENNNNGGDMPKRKNLTSEQISEIQDQYRSGVKVDEIARNFSCSGNAIRYHLKGVEKKSFSRGVKDDNLAPGVYNLDLLSKPAAAAEGEEQYKSEPELSPAGIETTLESDKGSGQITLTLRLTLDIPGLGRVSL